MREGFYFKWRKACITSIKWLWLGTSWPPSCVRKACWCDFFWLFYLLSRVGGTTLAQWECVAIGFEYVQAPQHHFSLKLALSLNDIQLKLQFEQGSSLSTSVVDGVNLWFILKKNPPLSDPTNEWNRGTELNWEPHRKATENKHVYWQCKGRTAF